MTCQNEDLRRVPTPRELKRADDLAIAVGSYLTYLVQDFEAYWGMLSRAINRGAAQPELRHIADQMMQFMRCRVEEVTFAIELADIDWTRSADDLRGDPDVKARTLAAIRRFYAGHINGATASHDGTADLC